MSSVHDLNGVTDVVQMKSIAMHEMLWTPNELFTQMQCQKILYCTMKKYYKKSTLLAQSPTRYTPNGHALLEVVNQSVNQSIKLSPAHDPHPMPAAQHQIVITRK